MVPGERRDAPLRAMTPYPHFARLGSRSLGPVWNGFRRAISDDSAEYFVLPEVWKTEIRMLEVLASLSVARLRAQTMREHATPEFLNWQRSGLIHAKGVHLYLHQQWLSYI